MSRAERKAFNEGYIAGYTKGLYDGNPVNKILETFSELAKNIGDSVSICSKEKYSENVEEGTSIPIDEKEGENGCNSDE